MAAIAFGSGHVVYCCLAAAEQLKRKVPRGFAQKVMNSWYDDIRTGSGSDRPRITT
jgi:hypothetical protein